MSCFSPRIAQLCPNGGRPSFSNFRADQPFIPIPCGVCIGCRLARSQQWVARCTGEAQTVGFERCLFVTCTYAPEHNPISLNVRHHQLFLKRVRNKLGAFRFYMCGEYGPESARTAPHGFGVPHFHYVMFGVSLPDMQRFGGSDEAPTYTSATLTDLWGMGHVTAAFLTPASIAYVTKYVLKKRLGKDASEYYKVDHPVSGEPLQMVPEFARMSLKPGIGAEWFAKYHEDVFPRDQFPLKGGKFMKPPKYFETLYERMREENPALPPLDDIKAKRVERHLIHADDFTDARLKVRESCALAKEQFFAKRKL